MPGVIFCMGPTDQCPKAGLSHTLAAERRCDHIVTIGGIGSAASYLITLFAVVMDLLPHNTWNEVNSLCLR